MHAVMVIHIKPAHSAIAGHPFSFFSLIALTKERAFVTVFGHDIRWSKHPRHCLSCASVMLKYGLKSEFPIHSFAKPAPGLVQRKAEGVPSWLPPQASHTNSPFSQIFLHGLQASSSTAPHSQGKKKFPFCLMQLKQILLSPSYEINYLPGNATKHKDRNKITLP